MKTKKTTYSYDGPFASARTTKTVTRGGKTKVKITNHTNYNSPTMYKKTVTKTKK